ncbi:hypothetical protein PoB_003602600 [Plakobranchus ocellatus]|uniref:Uncharacterized protein n=1 Tax=Plakobranchus ocellatus TaxID=259542 RepID=A0AAV4AE92_9GAST|nr:hypothetical protein PoB_003602600 [Plakobranchus ocellatus]
MTLKDSRSGDHIGFRLFGAIGLVLASPQIADFRLSGTPSGEGAGGWASTRDRRVPADLRVDSLATVPPRPHLA